MRKTFIIAAIVLSLGAVGISAIRVKLKQKYAEYIALEYNEAGEPVSFEYEKNQVEKIAIDHRKKLVYGVGTDRLTVLRILPNRTLTLVHTEILTDWDLQSVQTCNGFATITARSDAGSEDRLFVFRGYNKSSTENLEMLHSIILSPGPAHHVVTRNCSRVIVAIQSAGKLAVVDFNDTMFGNPTVTPLLFSAFESQLPRLEKEWFIVDLGLFGTFERALGPKWICLNKEETRAYVSLHINNGIAVVDLRPGQETIKQMIGLGLKSWSDPRVTQGVDGSSVLKEAKLVNGPVSSTFNPEQISCETIRNKEYVFLAGKGTRLPGPVSLYGVENLPADIATPEEFGDLRVYGPNFFTDPDGNGVLNKIVFSGSRSFALFSGKKMSFIADTGSSLEENTMDTVVYNGDPDSSDTLLKQFDGLSIFNGPEPELVITKRVCRGRYIVMVGSGAIPGHLFVYTLDTRNLQAGFVFHDRVDGYKREDSLFEDQDLYAMRLISLREPKGLSFVSGRRRRRLMIVSSSAITSTVELFHLYINCRARTPKQH